MAYNSAYTGSQVDAAVGAVRQKETKWDNKQDELTGTEDQLVGFNSAGEATAVPKPTAADLGAMPAVSGGTAGQVLTKTEAGQEWQNAPDGLPEGGTDGQILAKTADGVAWEDKPPAVFLVTAEQTMGNNISLDKDFSEIESAYNAGMIVIVAMENLNSIRLFTISHYIPNRMFSFLNNEAHYLNEMGSNEQKSELTSIIISVLYSNICSLSVVSVGPASLSYFDNSETDLTAETVQSAIEEVNEKTLPTGGTPGQMLYQGASGPEWGDKPVMYVHITGDEDSGYQADKTAQEIYEAVQNDIFVSALTQSTETSMEIPLYTAASSGGSYFIAFSGRVGSSTINASIINTNNEEHVDVFVTDLPANSVVFTPGTAGLTSDNVQDAIEEVNDKVVESTSATVTLTAAGWTGSAAPFSQQVSCSIVAADTPVVMVDVDTPGTDADADDEATNAWALVSKRNVDQGSGTLTFYCREKPTINIPVKVGVA